MKTTISGTLAFLLFAGASTAVLAQDQGHDRGGHGPRGDHPQVHQGGPPPGGGQFHGRPGGAPRGGPGAVAAPAAQAQPSQGRGARFGAPPGASAAPSADRGGQRFRDRGPDGQRFGRDAAPGGDRRHDGERRFQGGGGPGESGRQWNRPSGPREVIPPGVAQRGGDRGHEGRGPGDGRWNGPGGRDGHDGRWSGGGGSHWRHGDHWQRGRVPPVFWAERRFRLGAYRAPYGFYVRDWGYGDILPRGWYGDDYYLDDFLDYDLPYPPPGYEWVRVGGDAIMVDRFTGRIVQVVRGIFW